MATYLVTCRHAVTLPDGSVAAPGDEVTTDQDVQALVDAGHLRKPPARRASSSKEAAS